MRKNKTITIFAVLLFMILFVMPVSAKDKFVFGKTFTLSENEKLDGDLTIFGGNVTLEKNSEVTGDIALFGGKLTLDGEVGGDILTIGGTLHMNSHADIKGDYAAFGTKEYVSKEALIEGNGVDENSHKLGIKEKFSLPEDLSAQTGKNGIFYSLTHLVSFFYQILICTAAAILIMLIFEKNIVSTGSSLLAKPWESLGIGVLTIILFPCLTVVMCVTIVLIPFALLMFAAFILICLYAWIICGYDLGVKISEWMKFQWAPIWIGALGTFVLTFISAGLMKIIPCIGWAPGFFILCTGLGALVIKFGNLFDKNKSNTVPPQITAPVKQTTEPKYTAVIPVKPESNPGVSEQPAPQNVQIEKPDEPASPSQEAPKSPESTNTDSDKPKTE